MLCELLKARVGVRLLSVDADVELGVGVEGF